MHRSLFGIAVFLGVSALLGPRSAFAADDGGGIPIPAGTWTLVATQGLPAQANGWEQLVYVPAIQQSIMLSQYHQRDSEPDESLVGYNFDLNSWSVIDMGGNFHTESIPEGGESQGYFGFNPNNNTIEYHCCTSGSNQSEDIDHDWWYDVVGQSGRDKHTSPKPPAIALLPGGVFDPTDNVFIFHGGASYVSTWAYNPVSNIWNQMHPMGTIPDPSLALPGLAYSTANQEVYLFGGQSETSGVFNNDIYTYNYPTNTWTLLTPANGVKPPGRTAHGFAYDSTNNIFLVYGGQNGSHVLNDTWIYDPVANIWTQVASSPQASTVAVYAKVSYDSDHNVFVLAQIGNGGDYFSGFWNTYGIQTWLFRYAGGGPNAGTQTSTAAPPSGALNRFNTGWAKDPVLAASGNSLYVGWSEASSPFTQSNDAWPHIYVSQYNGQNWVPLGSSFAAISSGLFEAHAPSLAIVNGTPWISYYQGSESSGQTAKVYSGIWDGISTWNGGAVGFHGNFQGQSQVVAAGNVPQVALLAVDESVYPQRTGAAVLAWNGSAWSALGGLLNRILTNSSPSPGDTVLSVSVSSDGVNPVAAWSEYLHSENGNGYDYDTNPQIYVSQWNGSQWNPLGSSLNVNPANWAYDPSVAYLNGVFYVAWVERTQAGNNQLYVKSWNGASWVPVGSGALNQAPGAGWAFHPSLVGDAGSNSLYVGWVEQTALGQKARVFVAQYASGTWSNVGGALNIDPVNGSAQRVSIGVYNGEPVAAWGEVNLGATRQVFVAQWNGSNWVQLPGPAVPDTGPPLAPNSVQATAASSNRINLTWNGPEDNSSTDIVGITEFDIFRGGVQVGTQTNTFTYQDTGLSPNTNYCYTVTAVDGAGNASPQSPQACQTTAPLAVSSVSLSSTQVLGGATITSNTVTLNGAAPVGGTNVMLSSSDPSTTVPASVTVPAGQTVSSTFAITTVGVAVNTSVSITATYGGNTANATLTVLAPSPSTITLFPASLVSGITTTANTVILNGPAPAGGLAVTLMSDNSSVVVPASVTVAGGATISPGFSIAIKPVSATVTVNISAIYNGVTATATLTATPDFCDVDGDGQVNADDVQQIINEALGLAPPTIQIGGMVNVVLIQVVIDSALGIGCSMQ